MYIYLGGKKNINIVFKYDQTWCVFTDDGCIIAAGWAIITAFKGICSLQYGADISNKDKNLNLNYS